MHDRLIPTAFGVGASVCAAMVDINWGALAGGITFVGAALGTAIWQISQNWTKAYSSVKATEIQAFRDSEAAKLEMQRLQDEANKGSLSAKLDQIQVSADEANRQLHDAREVAATSARLLAAQKEINDATLASARAANDKLHRIVNDLNDKSLAKDADILDLRARLDAAAAELARINQSQVAAIDRTHTPAINDNATNIVAIARQTGSTLPVAVPHVEPIGSADDLDGYVPPSPSPSPTRP